MAAACSIRKGSRVYLIDFVILRTAENLKIDARSAIGGMQSFEFGFALFEAFDTPVSAASQNTNQFSKSSQSMVKFSSVQSI